MATVSAANPNNLVNTRTGYVLQAAFLSSLQRPEPPADNDDGHQATGNSVLAMLVCLVGLLGLFGSGSEALTGLVREGGESWVSQAIGLLLLGLLYLHMAWVIFKQKPWALAYAAGVFAIVVIAALLDTARNQVMDLTMVLMFFLAATTNLAVIGWLWVQQKTRRTS